MLSLIVLGDEVYDEEKNEFLIVGGYNLELEHSLVSLSKWESKHKKPFLTGDTKTPAEMYDYIKAMALNERVPEEVFLSLDHDHLRQINDYINDPMTATWFHEPPGPQTSAKTITNELVYAWMTMLNVPIEAETWHLRRLFTLLKVVNMESQPKKKKSRSEVLADIRRKNEERRKLYETSQ